MTYPRACALSEVASSPRSKRSFERFSARLPMHLERLDQPKVNYYIEPTKRTGRRDPKTSLRAAGRTALTPPTASCRWSAWSISYSTRAPPKPARGKSVRTPHGPGEWGGLSSRLTIGAHDARSRGALWTLTQAGCVAPPDRTSISKMAPVTSSRSASAPFSSPRQVPAGLKSPVTVRVTTTPVLDWTCLSR